MKRRKNNLRNTTRTNIQLKFPWATMYHIESCEKDQEASELIQCKICNTFMQISKDTLIKHESGV